MEAWNNWTAGEDETLRACAAERLSYSQAGERLGKTRNQVAGRARRLGVKFDSPPEARRQLSSNGQRRHWATPGRLQQRLRAVRSRIKKAECALATLRRRESELLQATGLRAMLTASLSDLEATPSPAKEEA